MGDTSISAEITLLDKRFATGGAHKKPTVVMLTDIPFWEPTLGSHIRVASVLRAIDAVCRVDVLAFRTVGPAVRAAFQRLDLKANLTSYKEFENKPVGQPIRPVVSKWSCLRGKTKESWLRAAALFLSQKRPDFVIIEYADRSYLLDAVPPGTRTILDAHDVMSQRCLTFARAGKMPSIVLSAKDEALLLSRYDAVMAISSHDATAMRTALGLTNVLHVPHQAVIASFPIIRDVPRRLLFTGGNNEANASGLNWFLDQVWPLVREHFELHVVGTVCDAIKGPQPEGIIKHGIVQDLAAMHEHCDIAINPVFVGGGIKIKTLEAMSYGLPCITTEEGARGLEGAIGTALLVARRRLEFVEFLMHLKERKDRRHSLALAAQEYAREHHYPSVAFRDLILFLTHA